MEKLTKEQVRHVNIHLEKVFYAGVSVGKDWIVRGASDEFPKKLKFTKGLPPKAL